MWQWSLLSCLLLVSGAHLVSSLGEYSRVVSYENDVVVRCSDKRKGTVQLLQENTDEWNIGQDTIDLRMARTTFTAVQAYVPECRIVIENVEEHVRQAESQMFPARVQEEEVWAQSVLESVLRTKPSLAECQAAIENWENARFQGTNAWFEEYHDYDATVMWYQHQATKYPELVRYVGSIGQSHNGLDMPAIHITASDDLQRHKIYFQCQIHAREWISGAVCMYIVNQLLVNYGMKDNEVQTMVTSILDRAEFIIIPFVNPDGYVYTWKQDRLWRKNRRIVESQIHLASPCVGVDINRNFPEGWRMEGRSHPVECSEDYGGPYAASEVETQNIMNYWKTNGPMVGAIDWHSYGKLILHPWAWTMDDTKHDAEIMTLGKEMADIIMMVHGENYTSEKSIDLYQCYGIATDWFYSDDASSNNGGYRAVAYVVELRDSGQHGFTLPRDQIIPTGEEVFPAALFFAQSLLSNPITYTPKDALLQGYDPYQRQYPSPQYSTS